jgi:hypothetical protein
MDIATDVWDEIATQLEEGGINPKCIPMPWDVLLYCIDEESHDIFEDIVQTDYDPAYVYTHSVIEQLI